MQNNRNLNQLKTAVITGASSGIGKRTAIRLAGNGYRLVITARDITRLNQLQTEIQQTGGEAYPFQCDVSSSDDVKRLVSYTGQKFEGLDLLFNNAGSGKFLELESSTDTLWNETIGSILSGTFYCCRDFLPMLKLGDSPLIINNASVAAHRGFGGFSVYSAAKGGIVSFSRALREELRQFGIRITTLAAGATDTPFWDGFDGAWEKSRMMSPEIIADMILTIVNLPSNAQVEELLIMPSGGAL